MQHTEQQFVLFSATLSVRAAKSTEGSSSRLPSARTRGHVLNGLITFMTSCADAETANAIKATKIRSFFMKSSLAGMCDMTHFSFAPILPIRHTRHGPLSGCQAH